MRYMTPIFYRTVHRVSKRVAERRLIHLLSELRRRQLRAAVSSEVGAKLTEVNVLDWMGRTALELVGQGGLGYSFDPLTSNVHNEFGDALKGLL